MSDDEDQDQGQAGVGAMDDFRPRLRHPVIFYMISFAALSGAGCYLVLSLFGLPGQIATVLGMLWSAWCLAGDLSHWKKQGGGHAWEKHHERRRGLARRLP